MRPWLFHIGNLGVPSYWVLLLIGFSAAMYWIYREAGRDGLDARRLMDLNMILVVVGLAGARVMHVLAGGDPLHPGELVLGRYLEKPEDIFGFGSGLVLYGGILFGLPAALWYLRRRKMSITRSLDIYAVGFPLGLVFGRLGCFLAGCCHGKPTDLPWGIAYHDPLSLARPLDTALHPTQLYSAAMAAFLFLVLFVYKRRFSKYPGQVFLSLAVLYPAGRFLLEFLRNDSRGMFFDGNFSASQVVSLVIMVVAGAWLLVANRRRARQEGGTG